MGRYVIRRLLWVVLVVLVVTLITFVIFFVMPPGDPAVRLAGKQPTPELVAEVREQLGLDKPVYQQYGLFVKRLAPGDDYGWPGLGFSYDSRHPGQGRDLIAGAPVSFQLAIGAAIIWLVMGVSIGILSALKRRTFDRTGPRWASPSSGCRRRCSCSACSASTSSGRSSAWLPGTGYVDRSARTPSTGSST